jgi:hypothetical protein
MARNIDSVSANGVITAIIKFWFQRLVISAIATIKPENRYNIDESGIMEVYRANGLVVRSSERRSIQRNSLVLVRGPHLSNVSRLPVKLFFHL